MKKFVVQMCVFVFLCGLFAACKGNDKGSDKGVVSENDENIISEIRDMVWIQPGTFMMGSPESEADRDAVYETRHEVTLTKGFYMGKYQVTQELYQLVMATNPSSFTNAAATRRPVETVSWYETLVFCNTLSKLSNLSPVYKINGSTDPARWGAVPTESDETWDAVVMVSGANGYRLPTEAEWEYACRAGTATPFNWGTAVLRERQANYRASDLDAYNTVTGTYLQETTGVGSYAPNDRGLYDMHGNVWEWCWDWFAEYGTVAATDPEGADSGSGRAIRGGAWFSYGQNLRSACRDYGIPTDRGDGLGFRLVRAATRR